MSLLDKKDCGKVELNQELSRETLAGEWLQSVRNKTIRSSKGKCDASPVIPPKR